MSAEDLSGRLSGRVDDDSGNHLTRGSTEAVTRDDSLAIQTLTAERPARPQGGRLGLVAASLSDVDRQVLDLLSLVRMASGAQLNRLFWPLTPSGARSARRHLHHLTELRILTRLHRQVGGIKGGSQGYTYALDVIGQRLVQAEHRRTIRRPTPSDFFVDHTLGVTDIYVELSTSGGVELVGFQPEPDCWRELVGPAGRTLMLRPDAYAQWTTDEWELSAFFEVDRATEHPGRVARKIEQYVRYWRTGTEQRERQVFPSVVWVTPHARRAAVLCSIVNGLDPPERRLFHVITADELSAFVINTSREEGHP